MTPDEVAQRLDKAKKTPRGWEARCPAHDDRVASLGVAEAEDGKVLLMCQAGCSFESIVQAAGLEMKDMFNEAPVYRPSAHAQVVDTYVYEDEFGVPSYKVDRLYPKSFRQAHWDPEKDAWLPSMNGTRRVPFRLPQLLKAKGERTVFFVEGEKDVLTLERLGFVGTTVAGGSSAWKPELAEHFKGARRVVVLPDNDEPGRKLAENVSSDLMKLEVDVQVINLPDLPPKGDVSDWVAKGHTREELEKLVKVNANPGGLKLWSGSELAAVPRPQQRFIVGGAVQEGLTILCGAPKTGKSLIAIEMCHAVATGGKALNHMATQGGNALFFSLEDSLPMVADRIGEMYGAFPERLYVARDRPGSILKNRWANVERAIDAIGGVDLLVVDTLACVKEGQNGKGGNVYFEDAEIGHTFHEFGLKHNCGLILIHHDRKMKAESEGDPLDDVSGSKGLTGAAAGIMMFRRKRFEDKGKLQIIGKTMADREYQVHRTLTNRWVVTPEEGEINALRQDDLQLR